MRSAFTVAQVRAAEENVQAVRRDLGTEVTRHWSQIQTREARAGSLSTVVSSTDQVRAAYWEQFQIGRRSMIDLLNAENETYQARVNAETELSELLQVKYRLVGAQALLIGQLGISPVAPVPPPDLGSSRRELTAGAIQRTNGSVDAVRPAVPGLPPGAIMPPPPSER